VTLRERTAATLILAGAVALIVAAFGFGGWPLACMTAGGLMLGGGVLLGIDTGEAEPVDLSAGADTTERIQ
jgi:hypothetical protein